MDNFIKILIVEDKRTVCNFLSTILDLSGYKPLVAENGKNAIAMALSHNPEVILLDLGLPDMRGLDVLTQLRQWSEVPVIVISASQGEEEIISALDAGANDYVTKPFGNGELLARIRATLRLRERFINPAINFREFSVYDLSIDYASRTVKTYGNTIHLTPTEYKIVTLLSRHAGRVLTHDHIIGEVWGPTGGDSQILRVNMANIRRKLEPNPADPIYILTEIGVGYKMTAGE